MIEGLRLVITKEILDVSKLKNDHDGLVLEDGVFYLWESSVSGLTDEVYRVGNKTKDKKPFSGVQVLFFSPRISPRVLPRIPNWLCT